MILMRETTPMAILRLTVAAGASTPSTRKSTRVSPSSGLMWMSEAPCCDGLGDDRVHELDDGSVAVGVVEHARPARRPRRPPPRRCPRSSRPSARAAPSSRLRSSTEAAAGRIAPAGHHPDVVDREDVRGVGHRQQQRAVVGEADRHRLVALGGLGADQVDGAHVEVVDREVDEVQAEALGDHAGELVVAQDAALDQHQARRAALRASGCDRLLDGLAVGEAEVDDHLADHPRGATRVARRVEAGTGASVPAPPARVGGALREPRLAWRCRPSRSSIGNAEAAS